MTALTIATLGTAFTAVSAVVNRSQERQLDAALRAEAREEAREIAALGGDVLAISDRPGPAANDVGPLTKYGAIYLAGEDRARVATPTFRHGAPSLGALRHRADDPFDLWAEGEHLRGVLLPIPSHPGSTLLLAAPRTDLDSDATFLRGAMVTVFLLAVAWSVAIASWFVRRLTRDHRTVAEVARRVAAGDLSVRVATRSGDREMAALGRDLDETIARLETLVASQQRFVANAAHELRAPLTTLLGEITFTLRKERGAAEYRAALESALESTERLRALADDLLALARLGAGAPASREPVALGELLRAAVEEADASARERGVVVALEGEAGTIEGRPADLARMLRNLLENGVQHSPDGAALRVRATRSAHEVAVAVEDEGPGVAPEERERIFDPFFRGTRERASSQPGAGLGLAIAREIAHAHGGEITVEDRTPGPGSRFVVRLPAVARGVGAGERGA